MGSSGSAGAAEDATEDAAGAALEAGAVLLEENRIRMRQYARVYRIDRPLALLATGDRPLSVYLEELYQKRLPAYEAAAHATVFNTGTVEEAARAILEEFQIKGTCNC